MRKLFMFLALSTLATFGLSCGSDDKPEVKSLVLTTSATSVEVGAEVSFTVTDGKNAVVGAVIKGDKGASVSGGKFKATKAGDYSFLATKSGFKESNVVKITVKEAGKPDGSVVEPPLEEKMLIANMSIDGDILVGNTFDVLVLDSEGNTVEGVKLLVNGKVITGKLTDSQGKIVVGPFEEPGKILVSFQKDGFKNSKEIEINVLAPLKVIFYEDAEYKIDDALLFFETKEDGTALVTTYEGNDYVFWRLILRGDLVDDKPSNVGVIGFASIANFDSEGKPILVANEAFAYLGSYFVFNNVVVPAASLERCIVALLDIDMVTKEIDIRFSLGDANFAKFDDGKVIGAFMGKLNIFEGMYFPSEPEPIEEEPIQGARGLNINKSDFSRTAKELKRHFKF